MKNICLLLLFVLCSFVVHSQVAYKTLLLDPIPVGEIVNMSDEAPQFNQNITFTEIHTPGKSDLTELKKRINQKYPRNPSAAIIEKKVALPPEVLNGFEGNSTGGSPLDNHMCISDGGQIISAVNSNVTMRNADGALIRNRTLESFTGTLVDGLQKYDPRVMYDPTNDRFIAVCLAGFEASTSTILVGASASNDVNGDWSFYAIEGNPFNNNQWTDYPMLSISETELFLTVNLIKSGVSWQEGFAQTLIYQIDLNSMYTGSDLLSRMWSDISFDGKPIRNLCPVKYADEIRGDDMFLLSNRNFDMTNDSIFILQLNGTLGDANTVLDINVRKTTQPYGVPPNAIDATGELQTNDARILDAIIIDDQIQFVGNTRNDITGFSDVYHGTFEDVWDTKVVTGNYLSNVDYDLGYPGIAWTGVNFADRDVIIIAEHSGANKFPGLTAVYYDNNGEYSNLVEMKEGSTTIAEGGVSRWGDYIGIQRKYNQPGIVYTSGTYGRADRALTWVNKLASPTVDLSEVNEIEKIKQLAVFPNPAVQKANVKFEINQSKQIDLSLFDTQGQLIKTLFKDHPKKLGLVEFQFDLTPLETGTYFLKVKIGNQLIKTEKIIKL